MNKSAVVQRAIIEVLDICVNVMAEDERANALVAISKVQAHMALVECRDNIFNEIQRELTDIVLRVVVRCFEATPRLIDQFRQGFF